MPASGRVGRDEPGLVLQAIPYNDDVGFEEIGKLVNDLLQFSVELFSVKTFGRIDGDTVEEHTSIGIMEIYPELARKGVGEAIEDLLDLA